MAFGRYSRRSRASRWLWAAGTVLLVGGTGFATWRMSRTTTPAADAKATAAQEAPPRLTPGHDYYFHVKLIELAEKAPNGKAWDSVGDSGPDICYSLTWRNNVVWNSSEKSNTLIGNWDLLKVDVRQIITSSGQTDLNDLVNAPLISYVPGEAVELKVWDEDTVGSDDAGKISFKLEDLRPGENLLTPSGERAKAIRRVVLSLIDRRTPVPELVNTISNR
jgi:hypothetical protein